jgi:hypothetical protein
VIIAVKGDNKRDNSKKKPKKQGGICDMRVLYAYRS